MQNVTYTIGSGIIPPNQPIQLKDIVESISKEKVLVDFNINVDKITCYFANKVTGDVTVDIFDLVQLCQDAVNRSPDEDELILKYISYHRNEAPVYQIDKQPDNKPIIQFGQYMWLADGYILYIEKLDKILIIHPSKYDTNTAHWRSTVEENLKRVKPFKKYVDYKLLHLTHFEIEDENNIRMNYVDRQNNSIDLTFNSKEYSLHLKDLMGKYNTRPITNALKRDVVESKHLWMTSMFGIISVKLHDGYSHTAFISPEHFDKYIADIGEENVTYVNNYTPPLRKNPLPKDDSYDPKSSRNLLSDCFIKDISIEDNKITLALSSGIYDKRFSITNNLMPTWILNSIINRGSYYSPAGVIVSLRKSSKYIEATLLMLNNGGLLSLKDVNNNGKTVFLKDSAIVEKYIAELKEHLPNNHKIITLN